MQIGDIVVTTPKSQNVLCCGSGRYSHAIVVSVDPFILVSNSGDMLWEDENPEDFEALCQAHPDIIKVAVDRFEYDKKNKRLLYMIKRTEGLFKFLNNIPLNKE